MSDRIQRMRERGLALKAWAKDVPDAVASQIPSLYPKLLKNGKLIRAGSRRNWNGEVVIATVDLYDTELNNPENAPTLWAKLPYKDGIRIIPEVISVPEAFSKGEKGWWGDEIYTSKVDNNVYTPEQYPDNWTKEESGV